MEDTADRERALRVVRASQGGMLRKDIQAAALLDQLDAVDARAEGLSGWKVWRVPLSTVLIVIGMGMSGVRYDDPVGVLIYGSLLLGPLVDFVVRRHVRRSLLRERESVLTQHEDLLTIAAKRQDVSRERVE